MKYYNFKTPKSSLKLKYHKKKKKNGGIIGNILNLYTHIKTNGMGTTSDLPEPKFVMLCAGRTSTAYLRGYHLIKFNIKLCI